MTIKKILKTIFAYAVALALVYGGFFLILRLIGVAHETAMAASCGAAIASPLATLTQNWLSKHTKWYNKLVHD